MIERAPPANRAPGDRAPVVGSPAPQGEFIAHGKRRPISEPGVADGTIAWDEHVEVHRGYWDANGPNLNTAEIMAERGGFSWWELVRYLGREPRTWRPR